MFYRYPQRLDAASDVLRKDVRVVSQCTGCFCAACVKSQEIRHCQCCASSVKEGTRMEESTLRLPSIFGLSSPRIFTTTGYTFTFSNGFTVTPPRMSGPSAKKMARIEVISYGL